LERDVGIRNKIEIKTRRRKLLQRFFIELDSIVESMNHDNASGYLKLMLSECNSETID
jgi:hypothetical protein